MTSIDYKIIDFDPFSISEEYLEKYFDLDDKAVKEIDPEDENYPYELQKKMIQTKNPESDTYRWLLVTNNEHVFGYARVTFVTPKANNYENTKHTAGVDIYIDKEYRRKGFGTRLFKKILEKINEHGKISNAIASQVNVIGDKFCEKYKGKVIQEEAEYRAYLSEIDWSLIENWKNAGVQLAEKERVKLESFEHCPEQLIEEYCKIYTETLNQRPLGDIEIRHRITPESRRSHEKTWIDERSHKWHTIISIESDGTISGLTEMVYIPESPTYIEQLLTGVREQFRGRGIGKWLKAEMALFIKNRYPEIQFILTDNADVNDPMLSINNRMNFKQTHILKTYNFDIEELNDLIK
ncbi:MAG: GNAT family N-acetyltransferase [Asgard group archaeon]|nr:GNAT family N-acetyltransferase [Asgard group archaeon]